MRAQKTASQRRTAKQWALLVKRWRQSGKSAEEFASSRGIKARTLRWWGWRLGREEPSPTPAETSEMSLVEVQLERRETRRARAEGDTAWELVTVRGDVLRVYAGTPSRDVLEIVHALASGKDGR